MTATIEEKAEEILVEGRLRVWKIAPEGIVATCRSSSGSGFYYLGFDAKRREWRCTCPVLGKRGCSHLAALRLVVHEPANDTTKGEPNGE